MKQLEKVFGVWVFVLAAALAAQTPPDFSGRWASATPAAASGVRGVSIEPGTLGSGWGTELTIDQRAGQLTVDRLQFSTYDMQPPLRFIYALDGSESRNVVNMGRGPQEFVSRANWEGTTLVITTTYDFRDPVSGKITSGGMRQAVTLDSSGSLVVTTAHRGSEVTAATTYKKR
jgi:hypothetical protein